ncbi:hypothetical protein [Bradyrhizobium sp. LA2.1]|uniref:hypothetical protein n=1 Tax=Bradyrhizobium sp. LA2.1 TaxID=3156376 RepID=UPI003396D5FB
MIKIEFESIMRSQFRRSANWRKNNSRRFPNDSSRNEQAAQWLLDFESSIVFDDEIWRKLQPHIVDRNIALAALTDTNRDVGFRTHPADFPAWMLEFENNLLAAN